MNLPNFLIIGASKAATTSLYHYLKAHPDVFMSEVKEVNFFAYSPDGLGFPSEWAKEKHHEFPARTIDEYAALFSDAGSCKAVGEASPLYLDSPLAPVRMREIVPDARLIISLRNPVDRIFSDYKMRARCGFTTESFEEEFQPGKQLYELGFMAPRVANYLKLFRREQVKDLLFEDISEDPARVIRELYAFLGVDPDFHPEVGKRYNTDPEGRIRDRPSGIRGVARSAKHWLSGRNRTPKIPPMAVEHLAAFNASLEASREKIHRTYHEDILQLQDLIGRDLSAWLRR